MNTIEQRPLPHDLDAEKAILGAILLHSELFSTARGVVTGDAFFRVAHRLIFEAMQQLADAHAPIDTISVKDALKIGGNLDTVGGPAYLSSLTDGVPRSTNIDHYARIVKEKARLRDIISEASKAVEAAYEHDATAALIATSAQAGLVRIAQDREQEAPATMRELADRGLDQIERAVALKGAISGIPSGFPDLDEYLCGFQPSDLIIVAGRPGMGKTALVMNMAEHMGLAGRAVGVWSLEMSRDQLFQRMLSSHGRVDLQRLRAGHLSERDWGKVTQALGTLSEANITIDDRAALSVTDIRASASKMAAEKGLDIIIIDYLQLMRGERENGRRYENRQVEVASISTGLKALAKDLKVPVIVLSQLSRAPEARSDHRPLNSDLRESGSLEQDADVILFPYRPDQYRDGDEDSFEQTRTDGEAEIIIGKQRMGPTGTVKVAFLKPYARFETIASDEHYAHAS